jgi:hypothetical protein
MNPIHFFTPYFFKTNRYVLVTLWACIREMLGSNLSLGTNQVFVAFLSSFKEMPSD